MIRLLINALMVFGLLSAANPLDAASVNLKAPIYIEADQVVIYEKEERSVYIGHVELNHGEIRITADKVIVYGKDKQLNRGRG